MFREGLKENVCILKYTENKLKSKTTTNSNMVESESNNDIYKNYYIDHNNVINPYKIVEEEELKLCKICVIV